MSSSLPVTFSQPPPLLSARPAEAMADADSAPAIALLTDTLREAAARGASDIHVEPGEHEWRIRLCIDDALHTYLMPPPHLRDAFTTRIKVLACMDIAERRVPQDGRLRLPLANGNPDDYRVNSLPVLFGEKLVLRRLDSYCQLVAVSELAGALPSVLARLTEDRERAGAQWAKLRAALTYPVAVLLLSLAITAGLLIGGVPTFKSIVDGFGAKLPAPTLFVLALSDGIARWSGPFALFCLVTGIAFKRLLKRVPAARSAFDRAVLKLPLAGSLLRALAVARWSRALGTLLAAGTPLSDAFDSLSSATGNRLFDTATVEIAKRLRQGERLAAAMRAIGCFPQDEVQPIAVAKESGSLDAMLLDLATLGDPQVDEQTSAFASLCEPVVIVVLGALVGGLVVAMYLPIVHLGNVV